MTRLKMLLYWGNNFLAILGYLLFSFCGDYSNTTSLTKARMALFFISCIPCIGMIILVATKKSVRTHGAESKVLKLYSWIFPTQQNKEAYLPMFRVSLNISYVFFSVIGYLALFVVVYNQSVVLENLKNILAL